ncbi:S-adenosyl-L-methionine-dependent methyltransferase [Astrocystis sublimbata]|nr:S-adenosyl-L-methionine-dependent methyltransferase [Astrocystis sublimbata]
MPDSPIVELANRIATNTAKVSEYLAQNNLSQPSANVDTPPYGPLPKDTPSDIVELRQAVLDDTAELQYLMLGPRDYLFTNFTHNTLLPLQAATRFGLARNLPPNGETTFSEMAASASSEISEPDVRRLVRYAIALRVFSEPRPGVIAHSAASRLLAEDAGVHDYIATCSDELWQAAAQQCNAMVRFPGSQEPSQTGFSLANNTDMSMYQYLSYHPLRSARFANMMRGFTGGSAFDLRFITDFYDWAQHGGGTIVDVGGSQGFVCVALARKFRTLSFVVQDLASVIEDARKDVPTDPDIASRISYAVHDFFEPQPVIGAEVYFLRWIFHNWSDKYCVKILQNLIPALKKGSKIMISDAVLPGANEVPKRVERQMRSFDLVMGAIQNAKERELGDWAELFRVADERFEFQGATRPPGSNHSLIVAVWTG